MTESNPPHGPPPGPRPGRDDDPDATAADLDALELVHASVDGELTADEEAAVSPDESWRTQVEEARAAQDTVQKALAVPPVDDARRETHIAAALAAFDELSGGDPIAVPAPASQQHQDPSQQDHGDETGGPGDELAHRRRAREWLRRAPLGIAAAILAAVVVVGATQFADDDSTTDTVASGDDSDDGDVATDAGGTGDGTTSGDAAMETSEADMEAAPSDGADDSFGSTESGMVSYALDDEPGSLDLFVDRVFGMVAGDEGTQPRAIEQDHLELGSRCSEDAVVDLAANRADKPNLTLVQGVLDGREVVGVIDRTDPTQVTIIDLDRCAVVAVRSP